MRITSSAVVLSLLVACDDGASPTVDTSIVLPGGGIETTLPVGSDPQTTAAPNADAGGGGAAPSPTGAGTAP
jgi:hypothetical protein